MGHESEGHAEPPEAEPPSCRNAGAIQLVYVRPPGLELSALDQCIADIVQRYHPLVELVAVEEMAGFSSLQPVVMVVRDGAVVGEAMGTLLPARELDGVVRSAVDRLV